MICRVLFMYKRSVDDTCAKSLSGGGVLWVLVRSDCGEATRERQGSTGASSKHDGPLGKSRMHVMFLAARTSEHVGAHCSTVRTPRRPTVRTSVQYIEYRAHSELRLTEIPSLSRRGTRIEGFPRQETNNTAGPRCS